ncbi:MAG: hypothetical protein K2K47_03705 [Duncaniella sp.]|nr:hypothetical protein [Duncaniella sp.]
MKHFALFLSACLLIIAAISCNNITGAPVTTSVNKDILVAIYETSDSDSKIDTISPCLMKETVHVSELLKYPDNDGITVPFTFTDTAKFAEITEANIEKRIAICVNGEVVYTPVVKMKLENGACCVVLNNKQVEALFPNVEIK